MKNGGEGKILTPEDILQEYKSLQKELDNVVQQSQREKASKDIWKIVTLVILSVFIRVHPWLKEI